MKFSQKDIRVLEAFCLVAKDCEHHSDISMGKIAQKLGMSRQGLTRTYNNVNEIIAALRYYVDQQVKETISKLNKEKPDEFIKDFAYQVLPLLYEKRDYLSVLYRGVADPTWYDYLDKSYYDILFPYFQPVGTKDESFSALTTHVAIRQFISVLSPWLTEQNPENPLTFSKKFIFLMTHSVTEMMDEHQVIGFLES